MKCTVTSLIVLLALLGAGCDSADLLGDGEYRYAAYDSDGEVIVTGTLQLSFSDSDEVRFPVRITGMRDLKRHQATDSIGPHAGGGRIEGTINADGEVWIALNPNWADNNINLNGRFVDGDDRVLRGTWIYYNFGGAAATGTFEARR